MVENDKEKVKIETEVLIEKDHNPEENPEESGWYGAAGTQFRWLATSEGKRFVCTC